jgi:glycosyltransferase involved in cell wall biosynthesis
MEALPKLSLVICTRNRAAQLKTCLDTLGKIVTRHTWQLVIVNNGSTDSTAEVIESFIKESSISTCYVLETKPGLSAARNTGWQSANTNFIAFIDDDCYPNPDYVDTLMHAFSGDLKLGFVGGRVLLYDPTDLPITIQTHNQKIDFLPNTTIMAGTIHGANFAFRREALNAAKGFDELFGAGKKYPCEDVDTMAEILRLGWAGLYEPSIVVYHHHMRKLPSEAEQLMKSYDIGRGAFFAKRIFKSGTRLTYLSIWLRRTRWQPVAVTIREIKSGLNYLIDKARSNTN